MPDRPPPRPLRPTRPLVRPPGARPARSRSHARLHRQFDRLRRALPWLDGWIRHLQADRSALLRVPLAILLILGGFFAVLPVFGLWMLPLGIMLLALDIPALQGPVAVASIRLRQWWRRRRRRRR